MHNPPEIRPACHRGGRARDSSERIGPGNGRGGVVPDLRGLVGSRSVVFEGRRKSHGQRRANDPARCRAGRGRGWSPMSQLSLFADADGVDPAPVGGDVRALGEALPQRIRLGTSSWSFPGWTGLVYAPRGGRPPAESVLARHGLAAYASHPLLRTVSLDRTFYAPLTAMEFARYACQVPDGFRFVVKAPAAFTDPFVRTSGSGEAARDNPTFLDAAAATAAFVRPVLEGLAAKAGPLVFQFPPLGRRQLADVPRLADRIATFVALLPRGPLYAVEVRDPQLACPAFAAALQGSGAIPCLAVHARMPPVAEQAAAYGLDAAMGTPPLVVRWNLHAGRDYEGAKAGYFPFNRLVEEDLPSRAALARLAAAADRDVFITINNKAEGSAPLSVQRLATAIVARQR
ncbi:MAG: DUF72 domain-containing protein [Planctomycetia bacterium]|nr:DUF72 domain-containing protein [Planctomycetia bacterium]